MVHVRRSFSGVRLSRACASLNVPSVAKVKGLCFTASKNCRAVCSRADVHFAPDRADIFGTASVWADAFAEDALANDFLFGCVEGIFDVIFGKFFIFGKHGF